MPDPELCVPFGGGFDGDEAPRAEIVGGFSHGLRLVSRRDRDVPDVLGAFVERLAEDGRAVASLSGPEIGAAGGGAVDGGAVDGIPAACRRLGHLAGEIRDYPRARQLAVERELDPAAPDVGARRDVQFLGDDLHVGIEAREQPPQERQVAFVDLRPRPDR